MTEARPPRINATEPEFQNFYLAYLFDHDREKEALDFADKEAGPVKFFRERLATKPSPALLAWISEHAANPRFERLRLPAARAYLSGKVGPVDKTAARALFYEIVNDRQSRDDDMLEALTWLDADFRPAGDASNVIAALNTIGFDAGPPSRTMTKQAERAAADFADAMGEHGPPLASAHLMGVLPRLAAHVHVVPAQGTLSGIGRLTTRIGSDSSTGTGFLIDGPGCLVVTSGHVFFNERVMFAQANEFRLGLQDKPGRSGQQPPLPVYRYTGNVRFLAHGGHFFGEQPDSQLDVEQSRGRDWAVGQLSPCPPPDFHRFTVGMADLEEQVLEHSGKRPKRYGYPGRRLRLVESRCPLFAQANGVVLLRDDICSIPGMSGGPLLADDGSAIGVTSGSGPSNRGDDVNLLTTLTQALPFIHRAAAYVDPAPAQIEDLKQILARLGFPVKASATLPADRALDSGGTLSLKW